jgi:hypothetical protein
VSEVFSSFWSGANCYDANGYPRAHNVDDVTWSEFGDRLGHRRRWVRSICDVFGYISFDARAHMILCVGLGLGFALLLAVTTVSFAWLLVD